MNFLKFRKKMYKQPDPPSIETLSGSMSQQIVQIQDAFSHSEDLKHRQLSSGSQLFTLMYLESLIKDELIEANVIKPLRDADDVQPQDAVTALGVRQSSNLYDIVSALLEGYCVMLTDQAASALLIAAPQEQTRAIEEPKDEQIIKGPHEGFVESLHTNMYLLRRRIRSPKFKVRYFTIGRFTNTKVAMVYMETLAEPNIVEECVKRISAIDLDYMYSVTNMDEMIEEHPMSPFPQTIQTGRPDRAVSYLMEGKINVLVDGNPVVLVLPITFFSFYQSVDDYNHRWIIGSFFRFIRLIGFILAISLPAIYIAIVTYHSEVLPFGILYSIKVSLTYVPFPPLMEAITMQVILELLKEAAMRLPSPISQTIGIVGGLVIGTAVVEANLVSDTMIVVIGLTAIASFATPLNEFGTSLRILGFPTMLAAAMFGFFGIAVVLMIIFIHLCKIETMGVPFFAPFGPFHGREGGKDIFLRLPIWKNESDDRINGKLLSFLKRWKRT